MTSSNQPLRNFPTKRQTKRAKCTRKTKQSCYWPTYRAVWVHSVIIYFHACIRYAHQHDAVPRQPYFFRKQQIIENWSNLVSNSSLHHMQDATSSQNLRRPSKLRVPQSVWLTLVNLILISNKQRYLYNQLDLRHIPVRRPILRDFIRHRELQKHWIWYKNRQHTNSHNLHFSKTPKHWLTSHFSSISQTLKFIHSLHSLGTSRSIYNLSDSAMEIVNRKG